MSKIIEVNNVVKTFGKVRALDGVSLHVKEGKVYGLLGPNGAGKTTLVRHMATLLTADSGSVIVNGIDVARHPDRIRSQIALAGQYASVDEFLTGRENIQMVGRLYHVPMKEVRQRTSQILKRMRLEDAADRQVKTYSGGMRRRLDLGASLIGEPKILYLDEPTTGLDPRTRLDLWETIRELVDNGTTIVLTTQYLEEADELADFIGVIDRGKLIAEGTAEELKNRLGGDVVEFKLSSESQKDAALKAVRSVAKKKPVYREEHQVISVPVVEGSKSLLRLAKALNDAKIEPAEISLHRPSLDDVFLALTGSKSSKKNSPKAKKGSA